MSGTATHNAATDAFNVITATDGSGIALLNMNNAGSGTLAVGRGGTGVTTFGGSNTLLYTTSANTLSSITSANSQVLATNSFGVPAFTATLPAVSGANLTSLSAGNISSGTLAVARGGTGVTTFGGTNRILYTSSTDTLSSLATANSSVFVTDSGGVPSWSSTLPAVSGANLTSLNAGNISSGTLPVARGGTGVTTFGGVKTLLYTTSADTISSITLANSSVLVSSALGAISWGSTLPAVDGSALTNLSAGNIATGTVTAARLGSGTTDETTFLRGDQTWKPGWTTVNKTSDQNVTNTTTLQTDSALTFTPSANQKYRIRGTIFLDTTANGDIKYGFISPASPTIFRMARYNAIPGAAPSAVAIDTAVPTNQTLVGTGTTGGYVAFDCILQNGSNSTAFAFQFAQNTQSNDAGVTCLAGSYIEYSKI